MKAKLLSRIKTNPFALAQYLQGMDGLVKSEIFDFVRLLGVPSFPPKATIEEVALAGAQSKGFNDCLDVLFNFKEMFLDDNQGGERPDMTFGSLELAVASGNLTPEEAAALKEGSVEEYSKKILAGLKVKEKK